MIQSGTPQSVAMSISGHRTASMFARDHITDDRDQRQALLNRWTVRATTPQPPPRFRQKRERLPAPPRKQFSREPALRSLKLAPFFFA